MLSRKSIHRSRQAYSIADLLIGLCAVLILTSLALPILVKSREQASKTKCADNMRKIVIGAHNFHDAYKRLPPGTLGFSNAIEKDEWDKKDGDLNWQRNQHTSSLGLMLPFIEQGRIYEKVHFAQFNLYKYIDELDVGAEGPLKIEWFGGIEGVPSAITTEIKEFKCPADTLAKAQLDKIVIAIQPVILDKKESDDFAVKYDLDVKDRWKLGEDSIATTNYLGCAGVFSGGRHPDPKRRPYVGVMSSRARMTLETVRDGTSNTIAYGETVGQIEKSRRKVAQAWFTAGLARGRGHIGFGEKVTDETGPLIGNMKKASVYGFGSAHEEGAVFALADGSTRSFKRDIDKEVFYAFCGVNDGQFYDRDQVRNYESPIVDYKVRPILGAHRSEMREISQAMMELKIEQARLNNELIERLKKVAEVQSKKKNAPEVDRAFREILKINPNDAEARAHYQKKGTLDELLKTLKEQGYPKVEFMKVPTRRTFRDRADSKKEAPRPIRRNEKMKSNFKGKIKKIE